VRRTQLLKSLLQSKLKGTTDPGKSPPHFKKRGAKWEADESLPQSGLNNADPENGVSIHLKFTFTRNITGLAPNSHGQAFEADVSMVRTSPYLTEEQELALAQTLVDGGGNLTFSAPEGDSFFDPLVKLSPDGAAPLRFGAWNGQVDPPLHFQCVGSRV
jgi:hypothetical protein